MYLCAIAPQYSWFIAKELCLCLFVSAWLSDRVFQNNMSNSFCRQMFFCVLNYSNFKIKFHNIFIIY